MGISVSGLASGIDSDNIIAQLLALEEQRIFQIQRRIAVQESKKAAYDDLIGRVDGLRRSASKFSDDNIFGELQVTSSDSSVLTARTSGSVDAGDYSVKVKQVATTHRIAAQGFVDKAGTGIAAGEGKFTFKVGGRDEVELDVDASTSLTGFANLINDAKAGMTATIVKDGSPSNPFRLVLTATKGGEDGKISISQNDTTLDFANKRVEEAFADSENSDDYEGSVTSGGDYTGTANTSFLVEIITEGAADGTAKYRLSTDGGLTFDDNGGLGFDATSAGPIALADGVTLSFEDDGTLREGDRFSVDVFNPELRTPQDAILEVNGITIRKSSNTVNDVFEGLTFNLNAADPDKTVNINVARDSGSVEETLTAFIGAYNGVVGFLRGQFAYDPADGGRAPPLNGDSAARQVERDVKRVIAARMEGLGGDTVSSLSELGIESNEKTGILSFTPMKLNSLMRDDPVAVERVLTRFGERLSGSLEFVRRTSKSQPGKYDVTVTQARTRAEVAGDDPAEQLANDEQLTFSFNRRAQNDGNPSIFTVDLTSGDTPEQQASKINGVFEDRSYAMNAFLDATGALRIRATDYGDDFAISVSSNRAAGVGTTQLGIAGRSDTGTDLEGLINGAPADVVDGNHLKGRKGFQTEGIEVIAPDDIDGHIGKVRIVDGLAAKMPKIIEGLTGGKGILRSRSAGVSTRIQTLEDEITRQSRRIEATESRLRRQFTNMEVTMGKLDALGSYVTQQMEAIAGMNKKKK